MKSLDYIQNSTVSLSTKVIMQKHLVCNSCANSAAFPECLDRAQHSGNARRWFEGRVAGRMFRRIWPSFLPSIALPVFIPQYLSFLLHSLPCSFHPNYHFHSSLSLPRSFSAPHFCLVKKSLLANPVFPSLMQDFRSAVTEAEGEEGEPVLEEQRLGEIMGVLPQVYTLHSSILTELEERISQW